MAERALLDEQGFTSFDASRRKGVRLLPLRRRRSWRLGEDKRTGDKQGGGSARKARAKIHRGPPDFLASLNSTLYFGSRAGRFGKVAFGLAIRSLSVRQFQPCEGHHGVCDGIL